jgi:CSLREA domain-containing protein
MCTVAVAILVGTAAAADAATIKVNSTTDDFNGKGSLCALREAVQSANTDADFGGCVRKGRGTADTILLRGGKTYTRSRTGEDDNNSHGDLDVKSATTLKVKGTGKATVDGGDIDRVIEVRAGGRLSASRLVVQNGTPLHTLNATGGGGILVNDGARLNLRASRLTANAAPDDNGCTCGGGLYTAGKTRLRKVDASLNSSLPNGDGGGIAVLGGTLTVTDTTLNGNGARAGGGIFVSPLAVAVTISRTTISNNNANGEGLFQGGGGGILASSLPFKLRVTNVTISGNDSDYRGGGVFYQSEMGATVKPLILNAATIVGNHADRDADGPSDAHGGGLMTGPGDGRIAFRNSIVTGNFDDNPSPDDPDCLDTNDSPAHNLIAPGGGCNDDDPGNVVTDTPLLGALTDNGGPTFTHALLSGSPAIGAAGKSTPATDQRHVKRDRHPDIGAYER